MPLNKETKPNSLIVKTFLYKAIQFCQTVLIQTIQFRIVFVYILLNVKTIPFQTIQFNIGQFQCQKPFFFKQLNMT